MKLYITELSPYSRIVRIVVLEKGLEDRVEIVRARTRVAGSSYYGINPSGRVPYLVRGDGTAMEDSVLICEYLDQLDDEPAFCRPSAEKAWDLRRLEALARSLLDGLTVWGRELRHRPATERSPTIIEHERQRSRRLADVWEAQIESPLMSGRLNLAQITLACALDYQSLILGPQWRQGHPALVRWLNDLSRRASLARTKPAPGAVADAVRGRATARGDES
jgi:glutathione S-transferase